MKFSRRWVALLLVITMLATNSGMAALAKTLTLPKDLKIIEEEAFYGDRSIDKVVLGNEVEEIGARAFANSSLKEINIPGSVTKIDSSAFDGPDKVTVTAEEGSFAYDWAFANGYIQTDSVYPQSEHPYPNNADLEWHYTHPTSAEALAVKFSEDSAFEGNYYDYLAITDVNDMLVRYTGKQLVGATVYLPGNGFTLHLHSDSGVNDYGFAIDSIKPVSRSVLQAVPATAHPYPSSCTACWTYIHPTNSKQLKITFADKCQLEEGIDFVYIIDADGNETQYTGTELAGAVLILPGNRFTMKFYSDDSMEYYGFEIVSITAEGQTDPDPTPEPQNDFQFKAVGKGYAVSGYTGSSDVITLPAEYNDSSVTIIDANAFRNNTVVKEITVPEGYTTIESGAFAYSKVSKVALPASVINIAGDAFEGRSADDVEIAAPAGSDAYIWYQNWKSAQAPGEETPASEFEYTLLKTGGYCIDKYIGNDVNVSIPSSINGIPVKEIGSLAFSNSRDFLESIFIPSSITVIGNAAFSACEKLEKAVLNEGLEKIASSAFSGCPLANITIPSSVTTIGGGAFNDCDNLPSLDIPESVTSLGNSFASGCDSLKYLRIGGGMKIIEKEAISYLELPALETLILGEGIEEICDDAFNIYSTTFLMPSLKTVIMSKSLKKIGIRAFRNAKALEYVEMPGVVYIGDKAFQNCEKLPAVTIEEGLMHLGDYAFADCKKLEHLELPTSLNELGNYIIQNDTSLTYLAVGGVETLTHDQFLIGWQGGDYNSLQTLVIKDGVKYIEERAFSGSFSYREGDGCAFGKLKDVTLPETLVSIGKQAFKEAAALENLHIPDSVTTIGEGAFANCKSLVELDLPASLSSIGDSAFRGCASLPAAILPEGTQSVGKEAFYDCSSIVVAKIPSGIAAIEELTFGACTGLEEVELPEGLQSIGDKAFQGCKALPGIKVPSSVTSIGVESFEGCDKLESVDLQEGLETIGSKAFANCTALPEITVPDTVTVLGNEFILGDLALKSVSFGGGVKTLAQSQTRISNSSSAVPALEKVTFREGVEQLGNGDTGVYQNYYPNLKTVELPQTLQAIGDNAFSECAELCYVTLPENLTSIGSHAFYRNAKLPFLTIPGKVSGIADSAFSGCTKLEKVTLNEGLQIIDKNAFADCPALTELTIPNSVTYLGKDIIKGDVGLKKITFGSGVKKLTAAQTDITNSNVETAALQTVIISEGVETLSGIFTLYYPNLSNVVIPSSVTSITNSSFKGNFSNITIYGVPGSEADRYAKNNGLTFRDIQEFKPIVSASSVILSVSPKKYLSNYIYNVYFVPFDGENAVYQLYYSNSVDGTFELESSACSDVYDCKMLTSMYPFPKDDSLYYKIVGPNQMTEAFKPADLGIGFRYVQLLNAKHVRIIGAYGGEELEEITVPSMIGNLIVDDIESSAFASLKGLDLIILPDRLEKYKEKIKKPKADTLVLTESDYQKIHGGFGILALMVRENGTVSICYSDSGAPKGMTYEYTLMKGDSLEGTFYPVDLKPIDSEVFYNSKYFGFKDFVYPLHAGEHPWFKVKKTIKISDERIVEDASAPVTYNFDPVNFVPSISLEGVRNNTVRITTYNIPEHFSYALGWRKGGIAQNPDDLDEGNVQWCIKPLVSEESVLNFYNENWFFRTGNAVFEDRNAICDVFCMNDYRLMQCYEDDDILIINETVLCEASVNLIEAPNVNAQYNGNKISIDWNIALNAICYDIYCSYDDGPLEKIGRTENTYFEITSVPADKSKCTVYVRGVVDDQQNSYVSAFGDATVLLKSGTGVVRLLSIYEEDYDGDNMDLIDSDSQIFLERAFKMGTPEGKVFLSTDMYIDLSKGEYQEKIKKHLTSVATEDDISVLCLLSHGYASITSGDASGALGLSNGEYITFVELSNWLEKIPGKVIIILGSCGSGSSIGEVYGDGDETFAPLAKPKFLVICAALGGTNALGHSIDYLNAGYSALPQYINRAAQEGDLDNDGIVQLRELETRIAQYAWKQFSDPEHPNATTGKYTAVYPSNSSYPFFVLKKH